MVDASIIYTKTVEELKKKTRRITHQGGQYSGKTVNILLALATMCSEEVNGGVTTVTAQSFPHIKGGALRDFEMYVYPEFKSSIKQYHKTDHLFTFKSGSLLEFKVFENEMAARGQKRKRLFINEANSFDYLVYFQLDNRSDQTILDYNPSAAFWAHEKVIGQPGNVTLISDHRHNPFLTAEKHQESEDICIFDYERDEYGNLKLNKFKQPLIKYQNGKPVVLRGDYELWKVYARGLTGNVTGVIFPDWEMIDEAFYPEDHDDPIFSIDFGYTNDPTAIVKQCIIGNTIFFKELSYEPGLAPKEIKQILKANGYDENRMMLYCEHDPDMIRQLRNIGLKFAMPARKGQGSINSGIEMYKQYNVKYTHTSRNVHKDRLRYVWEKDKKSGKILNIPVDAFNHLFDAGRYGLYSKKLKYAA